VTILATRSASRLLARTDEIRKSSPSGINWSHVRREDRQQDGSVDVVLGGHVSELVSTTELSNCQAFTSLGVAALRNGSLPYIQYWLSRKSTPNSRGNVFPRQMVHPFLQPLNSKKAGLAVVRDKFLVCRVSATLKSTRTRN
jgi:hypothetical protein